MVHHCLPSPTQPHRTPYMALPVIHTYNRVRVHPGRSKCPYEHGTLQREGAAVSVLGGQNVQVRGPSILVAGFSRDAWGITLIGACVRMRWGLGAGAAGAGMRSGDCLNGTFYVARCAQLCTAWDQATFHPYTPEQPAPGARTPLPHCCACCSST